MKRLLIKLAYWILKRYNKPIHIFKIIELRDMQLLVGSVVFSVTEYHIDSGADRAMTIQIKFRESEKVKLWVK